MAVTSPPRRAERGVAAMTRGITGIDHALVGVRDLEAARERYAALGFTLSPRGSHIGWGTANYCIMFPHDYVEILGIVDSAQFTNNLDEFLARREGLMGLAWSTDDAAATRDALVAAGIAAEAPRDLARRLELPEGTVLPEFKLVYPPPAATPGIPSFICQHLTPGLMRRPQWLDHANGALGLKSVTVVVADTEAVAQGYEVLLGAGAVTRTDQVVAVRAGPHVVMFAGAGDFERIHPGADIEEDSDLPYAAVMTIAVRDTAAAGALLAGRGIPHGRVGRTMIRVAPEGACGVWLELVETG
jgi:catechol 2,3-dioxygenase-like lactoylglutathione lyase family enzyme